MYSYDRDVPDRCFDKAWLHELRSIIKQTSNRLSRPDRQAVFLFLRGATDQEICDKLGAGRAVTARQQFHILLMERYKEDDFFS